MSDCPAGTACDAGCRWVEVTKFRDTQHHWRNVETGEERQTFAIQRSDHPFPHIHLFRLPRRELVLLAAAVASGVVAARYGLSWSEASLVAGPLVAGWVAGEVVG